MPDGNPERMICNDQSNRFRKSLFLGLRFVRSSPPRLGPYFDLYLLPLSGFPLERKPRLLPVPRQQTGW